MYHNNSHEELGIMVSIETIAVPSVITALNRLQHERVPMQTALKIRNLHRTLIAIWADVENIRKELFEQYAEHDEKGGIATETGPNGPTAKIKEDVKEEFQEKWTDLMKAKVDIPVTLTGADFAGKEIQPSILIDLGDVLEDAPAEPQPIAA